MSLLDAFRRLDTAAGPPGAPPKPPPREVITEALATRLRTGEPRYSVTYAPPRDPPRAGAREAAPPMVAIPLADARRLLAAADYVADAYAETAGVTPRVEALSIALGVLETAVERVLACGRPTPAVLEPGVLAPLPAEVMGVRNERARSVASATGSRMWPRAP